MKDWLGKVVADRNAVVEAHEYFLDEYERTRGFLDVKGFKIIDVAAKIPGMTDQVYQNWVEIRAIIEFLEARMEESMQKARKWYKENYNRDLTAKQLEDFARSDPDVIEAADLLIMMKRVSGFWEGLSKGIERLSHQVRTISDMRRQGIEESTI